MKTIDVNGLTIRYLDQGAGETILYLHGAGGRPPEGATFVDLLAQNHRVLLPSRPGFDETPLGEATTPQAAAEIIAAFVKAVAGGPVHVVGQSAGAAVATWLAVAHKDVVKSLIVSAPSTFEVRAPTTGRPTPEQIEQRLYGDTPTWTAPPSAEDRARIQKNAAAYMQRGHHDNSDLLARLSEIAVPTLILWAGNDQMYLPESALPFQRSIPGALRIYVYGAAHEMPISATARWVKLVTDFVDRGEAFAVNQG
jgi:pimeloyl-ACP methyl ester carboxylesterase